METAAPQGGIKVTKSIFDKLSDDATVKFSEPEECNIKGKGQMTTYNIL
jgi:hypothetical protein